MEVDGVFDGGGVKGIALVGALARLEAEGVVFRRVAGTSAGAVVAALVAAGYPAAEIRALFWAQDFTAFADVRPLTGPWYRHPLRRLRLLAPVPFVWGRYGMFSTDPIYRWVRGLLAQRGVRTFADCRTFLRVFAADITHEELLVFDPAKTPEVEVAEAVRLSLTMPILFKANRWRCRGRWAWVVDGGLLMSYPIQTFDDDPSCPTIGLKLVADGDRTPPTGPMRFGAFLLRMVDTMRVAHEKLHVQEAHWARTVPIETGPMPTTRFDLTDGEKQALEDAGRRAADEAIRRGLLTPAGRG